MGDGGTFDRYPLCDTSLAHDQLFTQINHACAYADIAAKHNRWALIEGEEELELVRCLEAEVHDVTYTSKAAREDVVWSCSLCVNVDEKWPRMLEHYTSE